VLGSLGHRVRAGRRKLCWSIGGAGVEEVLGGRAKRLGLQATLEETGGTGRKGMGRAVLLCGGRGGGFDQALRVRG